MQQQAKAHELMEDLVEKIGCAYVSDLRLSQNLKKVQMVLQEIDVEKYSLKEWNDLAQYVTNEIMPSESIRKALQNILDYGVE